jgi:antitoxin ParD1/3/4
MATMNISLPDKLKKWVEKQVKSGNFSNTSDFVRDVIRKDMERQAVFAEVQALLDEGEASGYVLYDRKALEARYGIGKRKKHAA